jgi:heptosyltransferase-3
MSDHDGLGLGEGAHRGEGGAGANQAGPSPGSAGLRLLGRKARRAAKRATASALAALAGARWFSGARHVAPRVEEIRSVLVIRIDERVGNVLLTTPLFSALREGLPEARVEALVAASKVTLLDGIVDCVPFDKRWARRAPWRLGRLLLALRRRGYDVVIDASHWHHFSLSSALLLAWTAARQRIVHARGPAARFATDAVPPPEGLEPEVVTKQRLLAPLGLQRAPGPLRTLAGSRDPARLDMARWLEAEGLTPSRVLGLAPGSRKPDHRAPPELFAALGARGLRHGLCPLILWGPGEESLVEAVRSLLPEARVAPPTGLEALAALMRQCAAVVTNDTGPMHLSVACGAPTLALFRGSELARWGHSQPPHRTILVDGRPLEELRESAERALDEMLSLGSAGPPGRVPVAREAY